MTSKRLQAVLPGQRPRPYSPEASLRLAFQLLAPKGKRKSRDRIRCSFSLGERGPVAHGCGRAVDGERRGFHVAAIGEPQPFSPNYFGCPCPSHSRAVAGGGGQCISPGKTGRKKSCGSVMEVTSVIPPSGS